MRRTILALVISAALLCADGAAPAQAGDEQREAWATVEIAGEAARRGDAALVDQAWLDDLAGRAGWTEFLNLPAEALVKAEAPEFKGMQAWEIVWKSGCTVKVERRDGPGIVVVHLTGTDARRCVAYANAVADWIVLAAKTEAKRRHDERKMLLDERVATFDSQIHLAALDKAQALSNVGLRESTFDVDFARLVDDRKERGHEADDLRRTLAADEATYSAFKAALADPAKGAKSLAGHVVLLRDDRLRDIEEAVVAARAARDELLATGRAKDHPEVAHADREIARAEAARDRAAERIVLTFVRDYEDRQAREKRVLADLDDNARELDAVAAVRRKVQSLDADIQRRTDKKNEAIVELEQLMQSAGQSGDPIRILTRAWAPAGK